MEVEFKESHWKRRVMLLFGVLLAIGAGAASFYVSSQAPANAAPAPVTRTVIVAARDIPAHSVLETAMLALREVPDDPGLVTAVADASQLVGKVTGVPILVNQPITPNLLSATVAGAEFSILDATETIAPDSPTWRAVSVMIPKERAVGGLVEVGQHVDLFVTVQVNVMSVDADGQLSNQPDPSLGYYSEKSTKVSLENIELLAKDEDADLYIFKVDLHQAEEIAHILASGNNSFSIALRPEGDGRTFEHDEFGETVDRIIEQYGLPIPKLIDLDTYQQPGVADPTPPPAAEPSPTPTPAPSVTPAPTQATPDPSPTSEP
jgi:Flp pilus assembly protein CpaB